MPQNVTQTAARVVGLGMASLDMLVRTRQLPGWEQGAELAGLGLEGGGPVATALVAAQRLGVQTGFIGTFGTDRLGRVKLQTLVEEGVDVSRSSILDQSEDQTVLVMVNQENGERVFSFVSGRERAALDPAALDRAYITSAEILHLDGYHAAAAIQAAGWMRAAGKLVMLDGHATRGPVSETQRQLVQSCDILICGQGFAPALTGLNDPREAGQAALELGPGIVIQTEGKAGSYTTAPGEHFHTPAYDVDVVDTTGAGDVFHGAFLAGWLRGWSLRETVLFSTAVSALKCLRLGGRPGIPCFDEALHFLSERGTRLPD